MIQLALRIALRGGLTARGTLVVRAFGIALGTAILLLALGAPGALEARGDRSSWRDERTTWRDESTWRYAPEAASSGRQLLHVVPIPDHYREYALTRVFVARLSDTPLVPPGLDRTPEPGDVFVSEPLRRLIEQDPQGLGARFGTITGSIAPDGLRDRNELLAIVGVANAELPQHGLGLAEIPRGEAIPGSSNLLRMLAIIGAVTLLAPVALFIAAATRLDAHQSEIRLSAMRLAGASPVDIRRYVTAEAMLAVVPGLLLGFGLFMLGRQLALFVTYMGYGFFPEDVALSRAAVACLVLIPLLVVGASIWGMRGVEVSPLGVRRGVTEHRISPLAPLVLCAGIVMFALVLRLEGTPGIAGLALAASVITIVVGLATTGPWIGRYVAALLARGVRAPALLLALRRIAGDARSSFRTVAGVSLAVFLGTFFLTVVDAAERETQGAVPASGIHPSTLIVQIDDERVTLDPTIDTVSLDFVTFVSKEGFDPRTGEATGSYGAAFIGTCQELARAMAISACDDAPMLIRSGFSWPAAQEDVIVPSTPDFLQYDEQRLPAQVGSFSVQEQAWNAPDVIISPEVWPLATTGMYWPRRIVAIPAPGEDMEALRSRIIQQSPTMIVQTSTEEYASDNSSVREVRQLVYLGILAAFVISGATGAISVAGSLIARRVPFSLLRLTGCPLGVLRRAIMAEAILPLLLVSVLSVIVGVLCGLMTIALAGSGPVEAPASVVLPLFGGLALGLALMVPVLPLIERVTRSSHTRFD